ncbi:MAG TPA: hypothetical protein VIW01_01985 [Dehalococcoidia bacterium]
MKWLFLAGVSAALTLAAACGGDGDTTPTLTPGGLTPVGTKDATPTPLASDESGPPAPADPTLDEELTQITSGSLLEAIAPGTVIQFDPLGIAGEDTGRTPPCDNFAFDFTWQVQDPYPPAGVNLVWQFIRDGDAIEVAAGPAGEQTIGCGLLEAENRGSMLVTVAIRYRIGAIE